LVPFEGWGGAKAKFEGLEPPPKSRFGYVSDAESFESPERLAEQ